MTHRTGTTSYSYDANGNMTTMPKVNHWGTAQTVTWDAWNRPITISEGATTLGTYQYDGLNRRIWKRGDEEGVLVQRHYYYSSQWQILEERVDSSTAAHSQLIWGTRYEDDLVLRDRFLATTERFYSLGDYFQPTAIADTSGVVQERYVYRAFGDVSYYNGSFAPQADSTYFWSFLYGSYYLDRQTLLYQVRNRYYHTALGRWLSRDPIKEKGGLNLYEYCLNDATDLTDPLGLDTTTMTVTITPNGPANNSTVDITAKSDCCKDIKFIQYTINKTIWDDFSDPYTPQLDNLGDSDPWYPNQTSEGGGSASMEDAPGPGEQGHHLVRNTLARFKTFFFGLSQEFVTCAICQDPGPNKNKILQCVHWQVNSNGIVESASAGPYTGK